MKFILTIISLVACLAINSIMGATIASVFGATPTVGVVATNIIAIVSAVMGGFAPANALGAGVFAEVWTGYLNKAFKLSDEAIGWYKRIKSFDQHVENDVIHLVNCGVKPEVLINTTTYPIGISTIEDADKPIGLDKYQTNRTVVTDDTLHAISYDKMASDIDLHKEAVEEKKYAKAIHAIAPSEHVAGAPVIATTGEVYEGRKRLTIVDILKLKKAFDDLKVPLSQRVLVLCSDHANDLLSLDQKFADQYANHETGKIGRKFGFDIYEFVDNPLYNATTGKKIAFGAVAGADDTVASVAFVDSKCMRADGSLKMYYKKAENNPDTQQSEVNFRKYSICLPMGTDCIGAVYSAKV